MPMGLAAEPAGPIVWLSARSSRSVEFRDVPEVAAQVEPAGTHDACFLPPL